MALKLGDVAGALRVYDALLGDRARLSSKAEEVVLRKQAEARRKREAQNMPARPSPVAQPAAGEDEMTTSSSSSDSGEDD